MTRRQMRTIADKIYSCELICSDISSSKEEKAKARKTIVDLIESTLALPNGFGIMLEIDAILQSKLEKTIQEKGE